MTSPSFSIVVNTCDRRASLLETLAGLERQRYPEFEVIVVVGPTRDDSVAAVRAAYGERVVLRQTPAFNLSVSRNVGLAAAAGEIVAFVDDDAVPSPGWLEQLARAYRAEPTVAGFGGRTYNVNPGRGELQFANGVITSLADQEDVRLDRHATLPPARGGAAWRARFHGTNQSYRRSALLTVRGFDERFEYLFDDSDMGIRMAGAGFELRHCEGATVYHAPGTGRNRGVQRFDVNWYCWLRSTLYFALQNGRDEVGLRAALPRALSHASWFWQLLSTVERNGDLDAAGARRARRQLRRALVEGFVTGLDRSKRRIPERIVAERRSLQPFLATRVASSEAHPSKGGIVPTPTPSGRSVRPLRVALLSAHYPPRSTEGIPRHTHLVARGLAELGHEVHVVTLGDVPSVVRHDGALVHSVPFEPERRYRELREAGCETLWYWLRWSHAAWRAVEGLLAEHRVEIADSPLWNLDGLVTQIAGRVPVVIRVATAMRQIADIHETLDPERERIGELEERFLDRADGWIPNSEASVASLRRVYGLTAEGRVSRIVPHGMIALPEIEIGSRPADGEVRVLFVGRLERRKGIRELLAAIPEVARRFPAARFLLAGSDNSAEDGFRERTGLGYEQDFRARNPEIGDRVRFLGWVQEAELERLYRECDLFVGPSLYESFGLIYTEAMNRGKAVVACQAGGAAEIVVDGETGRLVPPGDAPALAEALAELVGDAAARKSMGRAGRARFLERYTHLAMAEGFVEIYREVLERRAGGGSA